MVLTIIQLLIAVLLIVSILLQAQGTGLSGVYGGGGEFYRSRRSLEKYLLTITVVLAVLFALVSFILLLPHK